MIDFGIKLTADRIDVNPNTTWHDADHWRVTLRRGRKRLSIFYS